MSGERPFSNRHDDGVGRWNARRAGRRTGYSREVGGGNTGGNRRDAAEHLPLGLEGKTSTKAYRDRRNALRIVDAVHPGDGGAHEAPAPIGEEAQPATAGLACETAEAVTA